MRLPKRLVSGTCAAVLALASLMSMGFTGVVHAVAKTCVWTGATNTSLGTASNWSSCGGGAPLAGDSIKFNATIASGTTINLTNNLGVALGGVVAGQVANDNGSGTNYYGGYHIDTISLADGATLTNEAEVDCDHHAETIAFGAASSSGSIEDSAGLTSTATLTITGDYTSGTGMITAGDGSTVGGDIIIESPGTLSDCGGQGGGFLGGSSITGIDTIHALTVQKGASVYLADVDFPLTLGGGSGSDAPVVSFFGDVDDDYNYVDTTYTVSSAITLQSDAKFLLGSKVTVNVTGAISGSYAITRDPDSNYTGVLTIDSSNNTSSTEDGELVNPITEETISDSQPSTSLTVFDGGTTTLDGARDYVSVNGGGVLRGTGTAHDIYLAEGATVAPGHSPGKLTTLATLTFATGSTYEAEIKSSADGDFDQIVVGDPGDTTGNDVILGNATLSVIPYSGATINADDTFTIIDNLSQTAVLGTFLDLPEGATFTVNDGTMKISYVGGDGNDVVLTAMTAITAPDSGFALMAAHPVMTLAVSMLAAGTIFGLARKLAPARAKSRRK